MYAATPPMRFDFHPHQAPIGGRAAMRAWLGTFPPIQQFDITADEIVGCSDVAFVRGRYALTAAAPGSAPMTDRGSYMGLLRKQPLIADRRAHELDRARSSSSTSTSRSPSSVR
jgi:hypothetical protein